MRRSGEKKRGPGFGKAFEAEVDIGCTDQRSRYFDDP